MVSLMDYSMNYSHVMSYGAPSPQRTFQVLLADIWPQIPSPETMCMPFNARAGVLVEGFRLMGMSMMIDVEGIR